ncbi:hypothetical protein Amet_1871 [Alkaliphilus metalliredigens QYMF]|uniref:Uncharacterized protein n=1 Tax=Alkaliphilus metalliredigens (strain QYMF) TaxID=293826 RepID=A6TPB9_ALKMQ|nr:hypothetical protein [Alkaliphilus metalliredigens]ABR48037.1 hypothetical protein Amet_1871 [Alkaliphilus metalliredigens QYMF]
MSKKAERGNISGWVFINDNFDEFAIIFSAWSPTDGIVIAAPAENRAEALNVSNELMKDFLLILSETSRSLYYRELR